MINKPWTPRQINGVWLVLISAFALVGSETILRWLSDKPVALVALVQVVLSVIGPLYLLVGLYRIGTKDKHPSSVPNTRYWAVPGLGVAVAIVCIGLFAPGYPPLPLDGEKPGSAFEWLKVGSNGDTSLHIGKIQHKENLVEFWTKAQFAEPKTFGTGKVSVLFDKFTANCAAKTMAHLVAGGITTEGQKRYYSPHSMQQSALQPIPADPQRVEWLIFQHACADRGQKS